METRRSRKSPDDLEQSTPYTALPAEPTSPSGYPAVYPSGQRRPIKDVARISLSVLFLTSLIVLIVRQGLKPESKFNAADDLPNSSPISRLPPSRGAPEGVSEKTFQLYSGEGYAWTNAMLTWQRTAYHFQPEKNWMNDPNGPLYHKGWYHLFYQYNQESAVWGNITWGHAVSTDMIHWLHLPYAMVPDSPADVNGVWTGSATILPDGRIVMLYTGDTADHVQVQNLAYPANLSDPLLLEWVKYQNNPVLVPPPGIGSKDFRDPTTAWVGPDGKWRITIGSKVGTTGIALVYVTSDFISYELLDGVLHEVPGTGMWECVDLYPVSTTETNGLDTSTNGPGIKHVIKASLDDDKHDYYSIGTYDINANTWTPDNPEIDLGIGLRVDYGKYYASKTYYDQNKGRRILWGWTGETDSEASDLLKGWASLQTIPRTVVFDNKTGTNLIHWPIEEVESLRLNNPTQFNEVKVGPGSIVPLDIGSATQLDISATFEVDGEVLEAVAEADVGYNCTGGAANRGVLGPFGLLVVADAELSEQTPIYFYIAKDTDGSAKTWFCADEMRSSKASDVYKRIYGSVVPVLDGEKFTMRILVDHSVVESFAQGGRTVITSRVYPTKAINEAAKLFIFNNATGLSVKATLNIWQMASADITRFPF